MAGERLLLHDEIVPPSTAATLLHTLGGAVLVDLARQGRVTADGPAVVALGQGPADPLLRSAVATVARRPRTVRSLVPELGADLWQPVVDRLVGRGRMRRERRRTLGLFPVTTRAVADPRYEAELRAHLRAAQESGARPGARTAVVLAPPSAGGASPFQLRAPLSVGTEWGGEAAVGVAAAMIATTAGGVPSGPRRPVGAVPCGTATPSTRA